MSWTDYRSGMNNMNILTNPEVKIGDKIRLVRFDNKPSDLYTGSIGIVTDHDTFGNPRIRIIEGYNPGAVGTIPGWHYELVLEDWDI